MAMRLDAYMQALMARLVPLYSREEAKSLGCLLLERYCSWPSHSYYSRPEAEIPASARAALEAALEDLAAGRPIQYIIGDTCFDGLALTVREGVLIPRPETEELLRWAGDWLKSLGGRPESSLRIVDICTGSGALAVALAKRFPQARVYGLDISEEALAVAKENSRRQEVDVQYVQGDVLQTGPLSLLENFGSLAQEGSFDLIISNPPYVCDSEAACMRPNVLAHEPHLALFVPDADPLRFYHALAAWGKRCLRPGGALMMEINEAFGTELMLLFEAEGFTQVCLRQDLLGKDRMLQAILS